MTKIPPPSQAPAPAASAAALDPREEHGSAESLGQGDQALAAAEAAPATPEGATVALKQLQKVVDAGTQVTQQNGAEYGLAIKDGGAAGAEAFQSMAQDANKLVTQLNSGMQKLQAMSNSGQINPSQYNALNAQYQDLLHGAQKQVLDYGQDAGEAQAHSAAAGAAPAPVPVPAPAPVPAPGPAPAPGPMPAGSAAAATPAPAPAGASSAGGAQDTHTVPPQGQLTGKQISAGTLSKFHPAHWDKSFSDDFSGGKLDPKNWRVAKEDWGGGNNELQAYTNSPDNVKVGKNGLQLTLRNSPGFKLPDAANNTSIVGAQKNYTSGKVVGSQGLTEGRAEFNATLPKGGGVWPALWLLPQGSKPMDGQWPKTGEIDVMEMMGKSTQYNYGTLHFGEDFAHHKMQGAIYHDPKVDLADGKPHTFAVEWSKAKGFSFYVDNKMYQHIATKDLPAAAQAAFFSGTKFTPIMNVAAGGALDPRYVGKPAIDAKLPATMTVHSVNLYTPKPGT